MNTESLNQLRTQISALSEAERAALALELITSLDGVRDVSAGQEWDDEFMRRMAQVETGQPNLLTRDAFHQKMRSRIGG